jgi:hypothetical protein
VCRSAELSAALVEQLQCSLSRSAGTLIKSAAALLLARRGVTQRDRHKRLNCFALRGEPIKGPLVAQRRKWLGLLLARDLQITDRY